jgi:hypothetical protein
MSPHDDVPPHALERPPYDLVPPDDTLGLRHVRLALADLEFPARTRDLRTRVGAWRVPITGAHMHTLAEMLEGLDDREFRSAAEVAAAIARAHPELRD